MIIKYFNYFNLTSKRSKGTFSFPTKFTIFNLEQQKAKKNNTMIFKNFLQSIGQFYLGIALIKSLRNDSKIDSLLFDLFEERAF